MYRVKIYGAGSIGNHLAYACRTKGWDVFICDIDPSALKRTREVIYPSRYGQWDSGIRLSEVDTDYYSGDGSDLVIIGTPPDRHIDIATKVLEHNPPKVLLIEKPLCTPSLDGVQRLLELKKDTGTFVAVGYNHTLTENSKLAAEILATNSIGVPITISAGFREHWGGIFAAHPWLSGPDDSYLGFSERGGGASGEHSHAINIWQHFAHLLGVGKITEVSAMLDMVRDKSVQYDRICLLNVRTQRGLVGDIVQDVVTSPPQKSLRIQGSTGFVEWFVNLDSTHDAVRYGYMNEEVIEKKIQKTRPDDFKGEIDFIEAIMKGESPAYLPISLENGLDTMLVIAAAHMSSQYKKTVRINYSAGYGPKSLELS